MRAEKNPFLPLTQVRVASHASEYLYLLVARKGSNVSCLLFNSNSEIKRTTVKSTKVTPSDLPRS